MPYGVIVKRESAYSKPDKILAKDQLKVLQSILKGRGMEWFASKYIWILRKEPEPGEKKVVQQGLWNRRLVPFQMNPIQVDLSLKQGKRNIIVKPRQVGLTTYEICIRLYTPCILEPGSRGMLVSQSKVYGLRHFRILHRVHKHFGQADASNNDNPANLFWQQLHQHLLHTQYSPKHELVFDVLDSVIEVDTAENTEVGQGVTLNNLVCTEIARWPHNPEETMANLKESVEKTGCVDLESTPNGLGGYFYEEFDRAMRDPNPEFKYHFYEWWHQPEYRELAEVTKDDLTDEEKKLVKQFKLDMEQVTWRRKKMISLRLKEFREKYAEDPISCFIASGQKFFDDEIIFERFQSLKEFIPYFHSEDGYTTIFKKRVKGRKYVIGADPARGVLVTGTDTDFCAAKVIDLETGEDVAAYRARIAPEDFGLILADLGRIYNDATIGVERTGDGHTVMLALAEEGYHNIYRHREWADKYKKDPDAVIEMPGWPATMITRPVACNRAAEYVRSYPENLYDKSFLKEAQTFVRDPKKGRPEAQEGTHDDTVSAFYIAHYIRLVALGYLDPLMMSKEIYGELPGNEI